MQSSLPNIFGVLKDGFNQNIHKILSLSFRFVLTANI